MRRISVDNGRMDISLSLKCYKSRMMSVWKIFDFEANRGKIWVLGPFRFKRHQKLKETMWAPVMSVLTRWCHWEQVHSWPPICATAPQWWCWTAGVCDGSAHDRSPSQCWKAKQDVQKCCRKSASVLSNARFYAPQWIFMAAPCRDRVYVMRGPDRHKPRCHAVVYSHSSHPLITESHKGDAQPLHGDAVLLGIELVCPLFF